MTSHLVLPGYDTRYLGCPVDHIHMTIKFRAKNRSIANCEHESQLRLEIAGMSREVCESCGNVSVGFVENHLTHERAQKLEAAVRSFGTNSEN